MKFVFVSIINLYFRKYSCIQQFVLFDVIEVRRVCGTRKRKEDLGKVRKYNKEK